MGSLGEKRKHPMGHSGLGTFLNNNNNNNNNNKNAGALHFLPSSPSPTPHTVFPGEASKEHQKQRDWQTDGWERPSPLGMKNGSWGAAERSEINRTEMMVFIPRVRVPESGGGLDGGGLQLLTEALV